MGEPNQRRADDPRVTKLVTDMESLQHQMVENTEVTMQVRDILASFKTAAAIAKWITTIAAAIAAVLAAIKGLDFRR